MYTRYKEKKYLYDCFVAFSNHGRLSQQTIIFNNPHEIIQPHEINNYPHEIVKHPHGIIGN